MTYYLAINGRTVGPMSASQVMSYRVDPNTQVSADGFNWQPLYSFPELMQEYHRQNYTQTDNNRILCGIMAIVFGTLGIQYFILGKVSGGIITILLSLVTCGAWGIVTLIQGILMLTMSESEFERKYVNSTSTLPLF